MSSTVLGMATAAGRWSTARFHARRASSQWLSLGVTNSPVSCSRSVSTDVGGDGERGSLPLPVLGYGGRGGRGDRVPAEHFHGREGMGGKPFGRRPAG